MKIGSLAMAVAASAVAGMGGTIFTDYTEQGQILSTQDFADAVVFGAKRHGPVAQSEESKQFYLDRAAAKRARRRVTVSNAVATEAVEPDFQSRQVLRAEFRSEVKRGKRIGRLKARERRLAGRVDTPPSLLRVAAINAVSKLSRAQIKVAANV